MMKKLYRILIEEYDEDDATVCADEDWERDTRGEGELRREPFCDALFELADTWTRSCEAAEYIEFLNQLFEPMAELCTTDDGKHCLYFWRDDENIHYDPKFDENAPADSPRSTVSSPRRSLTPARSSTRRSAGKQRSFAASGQHWVRVDNPSEAWKASRKVLVHSDLGAALLAKSRVSGDKTVHFSGAEWLQFGVSNLSYTHFVHVEGSTYFTPATDIQPVSRRHTSSGVSLLIVMFIARLRVRRQRRSRTLHGRGLSKGGRRMWIPTGPTGEFGPAPRRATAGPKQPITPSRVIARLTTPRVPPPTTARLVTTAEHMVATEHPAVLEVERGDRLPPQWHTTSSVRLFNIDYSRRALQVSSSAEQPAMVGLADRPTTAIGTTGDRPAIGAGTTGDRPATAAGVGAAMRRPLPPAFNQSGPWQTDSHLRAAYLRGASFAAYVTKRQVGGGDGPGTDGAPEVWTLPQSSDQIAADHCFTCAHALAGTATSHQTAPSRPRPLDIHSSTSIASRLRPISPSSFKSYMAQRKAGGGVTDPPTGTGTTMRSVDIWALPHSNSQEAATPSNAGTSGLRSGLVGDVVKPSHPRPLEVRPPSSRFFRPVSPRGLFARSPRAFPVSRPHPTTAETQKQQARLPTLNLRVR